MSNIDKTSKQLIDSIRKTKAGPETAAVESAKKKTTTPTKTAKAASKKSTQPKSKPRKKAVVAKNASPKGVASADEQVPYPDGSQVWPD